MGILLNINGAFSRDELVRRVRLAEKAKIKKIWVGEHLFYRDPLEVVREIEEESNVEVLVLLSISRLPCSEVHRLAQKYTVGLIPGDLRELKPFVNCLEKLRDFDVMAGVSGPRITEAASNHVRGLLFNYVYPEYISWIYGFVKRDVETSSFGPSLILPSKFETDLLLASSVVLKSNPLFLKEFNLLSLADSIPNPFDLIKKKKVDPNFLASDMYRKLASHSKLLLDRFTISGSVKEVRERIKKLSKLCDDVVLGDPFFKDIDSLNRLEEII